MPTHRHPTEDNGVEVLEVLRGPDEPLGAEVQNMVVQRVIPGSPAWAAGLRSGMRILEVSTDRVCSVRELARIVKAAGHRCTLTVSRSGAATAVRPSGAVRGTGKRHIHARNDGAGGLIQGEDVDAPYTRQRMYVGGPRGEPDEFPYARHRGREEDILSDAGFTEPEEVRRGKRHFPLDEAYTPTQSERLQALRYPSTAITPSPLHRRSHPPSPEMLETLFYEPQRVQAFARASSRSPSSSSRSGSSSARRRRAFTPPPVSHQMLEAFSWHDGRTWSEYPTKDWGY